MSPVKVEVPTDNAPLGHSGRAYGRRSTDTTLGMLADSAILKLLQYGITAVAIPVVTWAINIAAIRLGDVEKAIHRNDTLNATYELRVRNLEQISTERTAIMRIMSERILILEQEMRSMQRDKRP